MNPFKKYGLSIVLGILFLLSWTGQYYFQYQEFVQNQEQHGQDAQIQEFIPEFMSATLENWQSEFLQLLSFVVLTSFLIHKGSHESKDSDDEMMAKLVKIEKMLAGKKS
jgi:hypothetical protein